MWKTANKIAGLTAIVGIAGLTGAIAIHALQIPRTAANAAPEPTLRQELQARAESRAYNCVYITTKTNIRPEATPQQIVRAIYAQCAEHMNYMWYTYEVPEKDWQEATVKWVYPIYSKAVADAVAEIAKIESSVIPQKSHLTEAWNQPRQQAALVNQRPELAPAMIDPFATIATNSYSFGAPKNGR